MPPLTIIWNLTVKSCPIDHYGQNKPIKTQTKLSKVKAQILYIGILGFLCCAIFKYIFPCQTNYAYSLLPIMHILAIKVIGQTHKHTSLISCLLYKHSLLVILLQNILKNLIFPPETRYGASDTLTTSWIFFLMIRLWLPLKLSRSI